MFNIDKDGKVVMLSTSLKLKLNGLDNTWHGKGVVINQSEDRIMLEQPKKSLLFFKPELPFLAEAHERVASLVAVNV